MARHLILPLAIALLLAAPGSRAIGEFSWLREQPDGPDWSDAEEGIVDAILAGDLLLLEDGRELRLASLRVPHPPLAYHDAEPWRRAEAARQALAARAPPGSSLRFVSAAPAHDRHRRWLVQAATPQGGWLQESLLAAGALLLDRSREAIAAPLLAAEAAARARGRGLWSDPAHARLTAEAAEAAIGRFAVIEGRVLAAAQVRNLGYLNFGEDWRTDFTIRLTAGALRELKQQERPVEDFVGRNLQVRGWVFYSGGPMIEIESLAEIEEPGVLEE